jgi:hypothetical protein
VRISQLVLYYQLDNAKALTIVNGVTWHEVLIYNSTVDLTWQNKWQCCSANVVNDYCLKKCEIYFTVKAYYLLKVHVQEKNSCF